ncbi:ABC transporter permease [Vibrio mangrovi]|uniref:FtsX-like permease family protein n=1 Tax=Vibrio mangrovi TaxID=474394 RepID=A0A1Y6IMK6_9VIBR|nr:FtsX-like permease family protein [Vibrio mangrovi]MDW6004323.1 FtsX-like permease family protein [Vibrio mangrovi]SMR98878.1 Lipoprotein-releasing system transmembrane protein LolE [Vibrio mangrovi]
MLISLAWRNLWRRPLRTTLSLISIAFAATLLVFMLSLQLGIYDTMKTNTLKIFDGLAQIQPAGYEDDPDIRKVIHQPYTLADQALSVPGITAASPRASSYSILAHGDQGYGAAILGIDPERENATTTLAATIRQGRFLQTGDDNAVIMGEALALNLKVGIGDNVTLIGSARDGTVAADNLTLVGIFRSGIPELDRQLAEIPLTRFQESFAMTGMANTIVLSGDDLQAVENALPQILSHTDATDIVVRNWQSLQPALKQAIQLDLSTSMILYATLVIVVVFIILNTLLMSVHERKREFGMLIAIGMQHQYVARMLWLELIFMSLIGNLAGLIIGSVFSLWYGQQGLMVSGMEGVFAQWGLPDQFYPALSWASALTGPAAILISVAIGGCIPVLRMSRLDAVSAMKEGQ